MTKSDNITILLKCKKEFIIKIITSILINALLLIIPIYYSYGIDEITNGNYQIAKYMIIVFGMLTVIYRFTEMWNQKAFYDLYYALYQKYLNKGLEKTYHNSIYSLSRFSLSEISNILSEDFETLSEYYSTLIIRIVEILQFIFIIVYFFTINIIIGYITILLTLIVLFVLIGFNKKIVEMNEIRKNKNDKRISIFQEIFLTVKEIKGFNIFNLIKERTNYNTIEYIKWNNVLNVTKYNLRQGTLLIVDIFKIIALLIGLNFIIKGNMTIGVLTIIYSYYGKLNELFVSIITLSESLINVKVANSRIYKLFQYANDTIVESDNNNDIKGDIEFKNVIYGNLKNPILNNVSFVINSNSLNVITGESGSGKTGIFDLLLRYNQEHTGSIIIDQLNIREYSNQNISNIITAVRKEPNFINMSIRDNLLVFESNFEVIIEVCKKLELHDYIMNLENGYDTILYNDGSNISVDVKYLLAIARVLLKNSKIMLFDETFEFLSRKSKNKLWSIIDSMEKNHTIIIISKDISIIGNKMVDKVIFLKNGSIVFIGKHGELLKNDINYQKTLKKL